MNGGTSTAGQLDQAGPEGTAFIAPPDGRRATVATLFERTVAAHAVSSRATADAPVDRRRITPADVDAFVGAVLGPDEQTALDLVRHAVQSGVPHDAVYADLLTPTAVRLGELWEADDCDFVAVTIGLGRMQRALREISHVFLPSALAGAPVGNALLTCVVGEQHTLGLAMIADMLARDGWHVHVGVPWTEADLRTLVRSESFDLLGFSLACESRLMQLRRQITALRAASRNRQLRVLVGGQAFAGRPDLLKRADADGYAATLHDIVPAARRLLAAAKG
ncbi:MAG: cobalamin B12-binding domain-containing protein [Gemmatimonadaceae bacterium]|jgi:methanogenic corrinoid protein MtbC1|nr:cobalamin B12-binding domain-containing protein [Gemmatimonadaceae bacterium]